MLQKIDFRNSTSRDFWLLAFLLLMVPTGFGLGSTILIIVFVVHSWIYSIKPGGVRSLKNPVVWAPLIFFIWYALSLIWSDRVRGGWFQLETKLSLLILPFSVLIAVGKYHDSVKKQLARFFIFGNLLVLILAITDSLIRVLKTGSWQILSPDGRYYRFAFSYEELSQPFMPPSYLATFIGLALVFLVGILLIDRSKRNWGNYFLAALFFGFILLLQGRGPMLALFVTAAAVVTRWFFVSKNYKILIAFGALVIFLATFVRFAPDAIKGRYLELPNFEYDISSDNFNSATYRLAQWKGAIHTIKKRPIFGSGIGDDQPDLFESYEEIRFFQGVKRRYNAHNQYLETAVCTGLIGLVLLLAMFWIYGREAVRRKNYIALFSLIFFMLCNLVESMFERAYGIILFSLWFPVLLSLDFRQEATSPQKTDSKRS